MSMDDNNGSEVLSGHDRNRDYIAGKEVDVSVGALSRKRNINLPGDFADTLQSADFYSTEKAMPAQYPLMLLSNVATIMVMNEIKVHLLENEASAKNIVNLYVKQKSGGKEVATPVGKVNLSIKFLDMLNYYLVEHTYFVAKGKKVGIDRASLIDYGEFNPIIDPGENVMSYSDVNRTPPREKADIGLKTFSDILRELQDAQATRNAPLPSDMQLTAFKEVGKAQPDTEGQVADGDK